MHLHRRKIKVRDALNTPDSSNLHFTHSLTNQSRTNTHVISNHFSGICQ